MAMNNHFLKQQSCLLACLFFLTTGFSATAQTNRLVYLTVEQSPSFPGGEAEMMKFIRTNLVVPKVLDDEDWWGTVYVGFVVEADGSLTELTVKRRLHPAADSAALALVKQMPKWNPGKSRKQEVATSVVLPIRFRHSSVTRKRKWWMLFN